MINWEVGLGLLLVIFSVVLYLLDYFVFGNEDYIINGLLQNIAFVPIQVLLVTMIINKLLTEREKQAMLKKMNMVIGTFFHEVGMPLLKNLPNFETHPGELSASLQVTGTWTDEDFRNAQKAVGSHDFKIRSRQGDLACLGAFMVEKRNVMLRFLENPNLLEHDSFTDLLWAVFHLSDELAQRDSLVGLPQEDYDHISLDIKRVYGRLITEWLEYMRHLKQDYPYLFSLAVRTNPFTANPSPIIQ